MTGPMTTQSPDAAEQVETFLNELDGWEQAYPLSMFPEPDLKKAAALLKAGGMTLDAISASNMRHVVSKIAPSARAAIAAALPSNATTNASLVEALESIRDVSSNGYDSDRAWALAMQLRAKVALMGWLTPEGNER